MAAHDFEQYPVKSVKELMLFLGLDTSHVPETISQEGLTRHVRSYVLDLLYDDADHPSPEIAEQWQVLRRTYESTRERLCRFLTSQHAYLMSVLTEHFGVKENVWSPLLRPCS
jgi:hypothetical protein